MAGWPAGPIFGRLVCYQVHWYNPPKAYRSIRITVCASASISLIRTDVGSAPLFLFHLFFLRLVSIILFQGTHLGEVSVLRSSKELHFVIDALDIMSLFYLFDSYKRKFGVISFLSILGVCVCVCVSYNFILKIFERLVYHDWYNPFRIILVSLSLISLIYIIYDFRFCIKQILVWFLFYPLFVCVFRIILF